MNDKDIIKALRCCNKDDCDNCPNDFGNCYANLAGYALDLIKRQRSEIEKLERAVSHLEDYANGVADKVKAEAIKEFADRWHKTLKEVIDRSWLKESATISKTFDVASAVTSIVLKEMRGKEDEKNGTVSRNGL